MPYATSGLHRPRPIRRDSGVRFHAFVWLSLLDRLAGSRVMVVVSRDPPEGATSWLGSPIEALPAVKPRLLRAYIRFSSGDLELDVPCVCEFARSKFTESAETWIVHPFVLGGKAWCDAMIPIVLFGWVSLWSSRSPGLRHALRYIVVGT